MGYKISTLCLMGLALCATMSHSQTLSAGVFNPLPGTFSGESRSMSGVISGVNTGTSSGTGGSLSGGFAYTTPGTVVSIDSPKTLETPYVTRLDGNYPNPFNPTTVIRFQLSVASKTRLSVYDVLGREVAVLVNEDRAAGQHQINFNASGLSSGVYLYRLQLNGEVISTRQMTLVK